MQSHKISVAPTEMLKPSGCDSSTPARSCSSQAGRHAQPFKKLCEEMYAGLLVCWLIPQRAYKEIAYRCTKGELDSNNRCVLKQLLPPIIKCPEGYKFIDGLCVQLRETLCTLQGVGARLVDDPEVNLSPPGGDGFLSKSASVVGLDQRKVHPEWSTGKHFIDEIPLEFPAAFGFSGGEKNEGLNSETFTLLEAEAEHPYIALPTPSQEPGPEHFGVQLHPFAGHSMKESVPSVELPLLSDAAYALQPTDPDIVTEKGLFRTDQANSLVLTHLPDPGIGGAQDDHVTPASVEHGFQGLLALDALRSDAVSTLPLSGPVTRHEESTVSHSVSTVPAGLVLTDFFSENISADALAGFAPSELMLSSSRFLSRAAPGAAATRMTNAGDQRKNQEGARAEPSTAHAPASLKKLALSRRLIGDSAYAPPLQDHCYEVHPRH